MVKNAENKTERTYFRVLITYNGGETSGNRVFKDREKAGKWAERQRRSKVVKKVIVEPFTKQQYRRRPALRK